jgi:hypothetical protein
MKKTMLTIAIVSAVLLGCNDTKNQHQNGASETVEEMHHGHDASASMGDHKEMAHESHAAANVWMNEIQLNDGSKWIANTETNEGVDAMLEMVKTSAPKTVDDYHALATKLNEEKNFVVKKCTMEGPSHDNLHVFLHPLIEKIDALGKVSNVDEGAEITANIQENLEGYYNYFQ